MCQGVSRRGLGAVCGKSIALLVFGAAARGGPPGPVYCTSLTSQVGPGPCPAGAVPLSPFTAKGFVPDGEICEFIAFAADPQEYFIADPALNGVDPDYGAIKAGAVLTRGVFVTRDNFPFAAVNRAGATGFGDPPGVDGTTFVPTGFNIGRVFASYNPRAYGGEGAYFLAMDISAPGALDTIEGTQPIAFDVDGDGNRCTQTEIGMVSEAPTTVADVYIFALDPDGDGIHDARVVVGERPNSIPFGAYAIDPDRDGDGDGDPQLIPDDEGVLRTIRRFIYFEDLTDPPGNPLDQGLLFLDANGDGMVNRLDVGVDSDVEIVIRNVDLLPNNADSPECIRFTFLADSFDDQGLGGGAEEGVVLDAAFPVPDIEVIKELRCVDVPGLPFVRSQEVLPGSTVEFRIAVQNWGNRALDILITDVLSGRATVDVVEGACAIQISPPGVPADFCLHFENALNEIESFPVDGGTLQAANNCDRGPGERLVFTFRAKVSSVEESAQFCDQLIDVTNAVTVEATLSVPEDPILPPSPAVIQQPEGTADAEEEHCESAMCCNQLPSCPPQQLCQGGICVTSQCVDSPCGLMDGIGDVRDEFVATVFDEAGIRDTLRELAPRGEDDNVVESEIQCRGIELTKEVRLLGPPGPFESELDRLDVLSAPRDIEYRFSVQNTGEVDEEITFSDPLCMDVAAIAAQLPGQISFVSCPICNVPPQADLTPTVPANSTFQTSCIVRFQTEAALRAFTRADDNRESCRALTETGKPDVLCYRNCTSVSASATNLQGACPDGPITDDSFATVCHPVCDIEVTKQVRCLDNCDDKNPIGDAKDLLLTAREGCVEFEVNIANISEDIPMCRLRISDTLADQPACIAFDGSVAFRVGATECPVPACFNVNGAPCDWVPGTCGFDALEPGEVLTITFNATIPENAPPPCGPVNNSVAVDGASDPRVNCETGFTCADNDSAAVDILEPSLVCLSKEWAFQWDSDADCEPEAPYSAFSSDIDLRDKVFPVLLRLRIRAQNTGQVPLEVTPEDPTLLNCVNTTPGAEFLSPPACELGTAKLLGLGLTAEWFCNLRVDTAEAMRALDACDGVVDGFYDNRARVFGRLVRADTNICPPDDVVIEGQEEDEDCSASIRVPPPCEIDVTKQVKCGDDPDSAYAFDIDVLPGSSQRFRIRIANIEEFTKIPRVCIVDELSCGLWFVEDSCRASLAGTDVTACICPLFETSLAGGPECYTFASCRPAAPWIAPGESLTITFDTQVPAEHETLDNPDCVNDVRVEAYSQVCRPQKVADAFCGLDSSRAEFDVLLSSIECEKEVAADFNGDGRLDTDFTSALLLRCDTPFPFRLEYRWTVTNTGQTPQASVQLCDPALVAHARAAGLTVGPCDLCNDPGCDGANDACAIIGSLGPGASAQRTCRITVPSRDAWENFAGRDPDGDANCHTNESRAQAVVDTQMLCDFGADINVANDKKCLTAVCLAPECQISVTKDARCLNCEDQIGFGELRDPLPVAPGSCVQFQVDIRNTDSIGSICRLRICDTLGGQPAQILFEGKVRFRVGDLSCPVPPGFNVNGTCFEWNPADCGLSGLDAGQALTITFDARVPLTANPEISSVNSVIVDGAPTCKSGVPQFCCRDNEDSTIDILRPALRCESKQWAFQWDSDGDCEPNPPFSTFGSDADLGDKVFPVLLRLRVRAANTGEVSLDVTVDDPTLFSCASTTPGVSIIDPANCEIGGSKTIPAGGTAEWLCDVRVEKADAMRDLDACDGVADGSYTNKAIVSGSAVPGAGLVCTPGDALIPADNTNCLARIQVPGPCEFTVDKTASCVTGCATGAPVGQPTPALEAMPGAFVRFAVTVTNIDDRVKIPRVCLTDLLSCGDWICPVSTVHATLEGTDVTNDFSQFSANGGRHCFTLGSRPSAPWIAPGERLIVTFDVRVPPDFSVMGVVPDCTNEVTAEGFTEICAPPEKAACGLERDSASVDVLIPRLECNKTVAVDLANDGTVDVASAPAVNLSNPPFPVRLIYTFTARNTGDLPLTAVSLCDQQLVADARAAGLSVGPCQLCNDPGCDAVGDTCRLTGNLGPRAMAAATCQIVVADEDQWESFAGQDAPDNRRECYENESTAHGIVTPVCAPPGFSAAITSSPCEATVCISVVHRCPVTKAVFDIWNQDERRFGGTERCIVSWDQTLLSQYTRPGIPNHFLLAAINTPRATARIDGVASANVCGPASITAPLLGVAAKIVNFGRDGVDLAGQTLIGTGAEAGTIIYQPVSAVQVDRNQGVPDGPPAASLGPLAAATVPGRIDRFAARGSETEKGSLLIYPKVEVKWDANGRLIQDTFVTLVNDFNDDVMVQLYFVNGDQEAEPVQMGQPPMIVERGHMGCNWVDVLITLTANQPVYWSALTGAPRTVSPFTILDPGDPPGRPDTDPRNLGGRVLRGYVLAWAVNVDNQEVRWNHLTGEAVIVNYQDMSAWDYHPWASQALAGAADGTLLDPPFGRLDMNGVEYDALPARLLLPFFASGTQFLSPAGPISVFIDTDLTLWVGAKDLRNP